jgi:sugar lactone lactonase YvrE
VAGNVDKKFIFSGDGGLSTSAGLSYPIRVTADPQGDIYIADEFRVRKVTKSTGIITTLAGLGKPGFGVDGIPATSTSLHEVAGIALDSAGNIYLCESYNSRVRVISKSTGIITTVVGDGNDGFRGDGEQANAARLNRANGVILNTAGDIYIADTDNHRIRLVTKSTGIITTIAGNGTCTYAGDGRPATSASLCFPYGVAVDASGNVYIADSYNDCVRLVTKSTGIITTIAGTGREGYLGDGGPALSAQLYRPNDIVLDSKGNIYFSQVNSVRLLTKSTGILTTIAGDKEKGNDGDGGLAKNARFYDPRGLFLDASEHLYIVDSLNSRVRMVALSGSGPSIPLPSLMPSTSSKPVPAPATPTTTSSTPSSAPITETTDKPLSAPTSTASTTPLSPPSKRPIDLPTARPTQLKPTRRPTTSPTDRPTRKPTTQRPSKTPTTTKPTKKPTTTRPSAVKPSTSKPSMVL